MGPWESSTAREKIFSTISRGSVDMGLGDAGVRTAAERAVVNDSESLGMEGGGQRLVDASCRAVLWLGYICLGWVAVSASTNDGSMRLM